MLWIDGLFKASFQPGQTHAVQVLEGEHIAQLCNEGSPPNDPAGCGETIQLTADADFSWTFNP